MGYEYLQVKVEENVCIITLDRPDARNAINSAMFEELCLAIDAAEKDNDVRVIIMTNTGKVFCAGADLKEYNAGTFHAPFGFELSGTGGMTRHFCPKPIIFAVNGKCIGGGAEMLLAADIAVMSEDGMVGFPEVANALFPGGGGAPLRIGRSIHMKHAMQLMLTGKPINAQRALEWGLVNEVVPEDQVLEAAMSIARDICACGPLAVQAIKRAVVDCMDKSFMSETDGWRMMFDINEAIKLTEDAQEGSTAFKEKRAPNFKGK